MPSDNNMKVTSRPLPLKTLFSKYALQAGSTSYPVRPLGVVRRPGSSQKCDRRNLTFEQELTDVERVCLYIQSCGMDGDKIPYLTSAKYLSEAPNSPRGEKNIPKLRRSQTFQNQFKLAVSRDTTSPVRTGSRPQVKRLITLPMYQVEVNTSNTETEDSWAVESTRKSLRNLMKVGKIKASHPDNGAVTANIRNFQFNDLIKINDKGRVLPLKNKPTRFQIPSKDNVSKSASGQTLSEAENTLERQVPLLERPQSTFTPNSFLLENRAFSASTDRRSRTETDLDRMEFENLTYTITETSKSPRSGLKSTQQSVFRTDKSLLSREETVMTSPATLLTTSTPLEYLNRASPFAPPHIADDYYTRKPCFGGSLPPAQMCRSLRDIKKMKAEACRQASNARRQKSYNSSRTASSSSTEAPLINPSPTIKYTQQPRGRILDPIIVPSHTNDNCPMCKLYLHFADNSSCPPNSPTPAYDTESEVEVASQCTQTVGQDTLCYNSICDTQNVHMSVGRSVLSRQSSMGSLSASPVNKAQESACIPKVSMKYYPN